MLIKEMRSEDKPRERFQASPDQVTLTDLVAILLRTGRQGHSVMELAQDVLKEIEDRAGANGFSDLHWRDLTTINGIGPDKAVTICAAVELGRRLATKYEKTNKAVTICAAVELGRRLATKYEKTKLPDFSMPENVADYFMEKLRHETQEHFLVCFLNVKNKLLGYKEISIGSLSAAPVDIKEAMKWAIRYKASGLILVHNHPSGYPEPSPEDIELTRTFAAAAKLLDMEVLDHVIIGDGIYVSLEERGEV